MTKIVIASLMALSTNAFAFGNPADFPSDYPTSWEQTKIAKACGVDLADLAGTEGVTTRTENHVVYSALVDGVVVAQAYRKKMTFKLHCSN